MSDKHSQQPGSGGPRNFGDQEAWLNSLGPAGQALGRGIAAAQGRTGDEITRRRMWSGLGGRLRATSKARTAWRWPTVVGLAGLVLVVAVIGALQLGASTPANHMTEASAKEASDVAPERAEPFLQGPAEVNTGANETMRVRLRGGTRVALGTRTHLVLNDRLEPELKLGRVVLDVPKQAPGHTFAVKAGPYHVSVLGTRFSVDVDSDSVAVQVVEGVVEVTRHGRKLRLAAGQNWTGWLGAPPPGLAPDDGAPAAKPSHAASATRGVSARMPVALRRGAEASSQSQTTSLGAHPPPDVANQARQALAAGDPDKALALLAALSKQPGLAGENASYEMGRVWLQHKLQPRQALLVWQRYQRQHPQGVLRAEVDLSVVETLAKLGDVRRAVAEGQAFLRRHTRSERRGDVEALVSALQAKLNATTP